MFTGEAATMTGMAIAVATTPTSAPATDSTVASASSWATRWRGEAPSAVRTATSRSRDSARVRSSEATFKQPITINRPTAPKSTISAAR